MTTYEYHHYFHEIELKSLQLSHNAYKHINGYYFKIAGIYTVFPVHNN